MKIRAETRDSRSLKYESIWVIYITVKKKGIKRLDNKEVEKRAVIEAIE